MDSDQTRKTGERPRHLFGAGVSEANMNKTVSAPFFEYATSVVEALLQCQLKVKLKKTVRFQRSVPLVEDALRRCAASVLQQRVDSVVFCGRMADVV